MDVSRDAWWLSTPSKLSSPVPICFEVFKVNFCERQCTAHASFWGSTIQKTGFPICRLFARSCWRPPVQWLPGTPARGMPLLGGIARLGVPDTRDLLKETTTLCQVRARSCFRTFSSSLGSLMRARGRSPDNHSPNLHFGLQFSGGEARRSCRRRRTRTRAWRASSATTCGRWGRTCLSAWLPLDTIFGALLEQGMCH